MPTLAMGAATAAAWTVVVGGVRHLRALRVSALAVRLSVAEVAAVRARVGAPSVGVRAAVLLGRVVAVAFVAVAAWLVFTAGGDDGVMTWAVGLIVVAVLLLFAWGLVLGGRRLLRLGDPHTVQGIAGGAASTAATATGYGISHFQTGDGGRLVVYGAVTCVLGLLAWLPTSGQAMIRNLKLIDAVAANPRMLDAVSRSPRLRMRCPGLRV